MFWLFLTLLVIIGGLLMLRRKAEFAAAAENEPWRASLGEDEPLDMDEIRRAEKEWLQTTEWEDLPEDESWR